MPPAQRSSCVAPANGRHQPCGIVVGGGDMGSHGAGGSQGFRVHSLAVQRDRAADNAALPVDLADFGIARLLHGKNGPAVRAKQLCQQKIQVFRAGAHHNLFRCNSHALEIPQSRQLLAQG